MKQMIVRAQKHASRAAKHVISHVRKHKRSYLLGIFGSFAIVKMTFLFAGFLGLANLVSTFAQTPVELNSGNIVTEYGCATGAGSCDLSNRGITSIAADTFVNHTSLQQLYLNSNQLSSIESGDFDGLSALTTLYLNGNQISSIESGSFDGLANLTILSLDLNLLTFLPESITGLINGNPYGGWILTNNCRDTGLMSNDLIAFLNNKSNGDGWQTSLNETCPIPEHTVTFNVDMTNATFDPELDNIYIAGSFAGWSEPGTNPEYKLSQIPDSMIRSVTLQIPEGDIQYKYFINGWAGGERGGDPNRAASIYNDETIDDVRGMPGCTDSNATNYDGEANTDDGSCEYIYYDCAGLPAPQACSLLSLADPVNQCGNYYSSIDNTQCIYNSKDGGCMANGNVVCDVKVEYDTDSDGITDGKDNCPVVYNPDQTATHFKSFGDNFDKGTFAGEWDWDEWYTGWYIDGGKLTNQFANWTTIRSTSQSLTERVFSIEADISEIPGNDPWNVGNIRIQNPSDSGVEWIDFAYESGGVIKLQTSEEDYKILFLTTIENTGLNPRTLKLEVNGNQYKGYVNGALYMDYTDKDKYRERMPVQFPALYAANTIASFDNFVVKVLDLRGDACNCSDNICTQGTNVLGAPICDNDSACTLCGNASIDGYEQCDDGNTTNGDGCDHTCKIETIPLPPVCAGIVTENCTLLSLGDPEKQCNGYYSISNYQCMFDKEKGGCTTQGSTCTLCGNASIDGDEQCDDGNQIDGDGCTSTCKRETSCGNWKTEGKETCDDGNTLDGDGCSSHCTREDRYIDYTATHDITILYGEGVSYDTGKQQFFMPGDTLAFIFMEDNKVLGYSEFGSEKSWFFIVFYDTTGTIANISHEEVQFVDGWGIFGMVHSGTLDFPITGFTFTDNGVAMQATINSGVYGGWEISPLGTICGNGEQEVGEACDDSNTTDGDGCDSTCQIEIPDCAGTGVFTCTSLDLADPANECTSYYSIAGINQCIYDSKAGGCANGGVSCNFTHTCGDNYTGGSEQCDDGNTTNGDGCSSTCEIETPACTGTETKFSCASLYTYNAQEDCQKYYSSSDNSQCVYDTKGAGGSCAASTSCTPPETEEMASCVGSQIDYVCDSIDPRGLNNPARDCSLFYSKKSQSQCTYNTGNARCIESTSCATDKWGIYVTYDTNSVVNMAVSHVVFPKDSDCTILNNGGSPDYLFQKNGSFYYKLSCPSVNKDQNIILMATVGWLGNHTIYSPNIKDIAKSQILYTNTVEGKGTTLDAKINEDTSVMTSKEVQKKAAKKLISDLIKEVYGTSAYTESDDTIILKNISLGLENDSTIYNRTTFETTSGNSKVAITVDENSTITIVDRQQNESQYTGVFISPLDVSTSEKELQHLEEDISGSGTIKSIYKFGSLDNIDGSLIARDAKYGLDNNSFIIDFVYNDTTFSDSSQVFYSEDGETWTLFTGSTTASGNHLSIITPHLTYYAIVQQPEEEQQNNNQSSASNGGGGGALLQKDICPVARDCSDSYYDKLCGKCSLIEKIVDKLPFHNAANLPIGSITNSPYSSELNTAYLRAYAHGITSMPTIQRANVQSPLIRKDMAKMITNFAINILGKDISTGTTCEFTDTTSLTKEAQYYAIAACRLGLMGLESDGVTSNETFNPDQEVDRGQFGTIFSRLLRGNKNNNGEANYYSSHLQALKKEGIMTKIDSPSAKELRGWVMLMMQRIADKK